MDNKLLKVKELLRKYKQEHAMDYLEALDQHEQGNLVNQILSVDFHSFCSALNHQNQNKYNHDSIGPLPYESLNNLTKEQMEKYTNDGLQLLRNGEVGVIVVAGGQGSRLGHDGPKGTFDIGLPSGKSLFQLQAERLLNLSLKVDKSIPWYIMTSPENHQATIQFFEKHQYFGYPVGDCIFFQQNTMPAVNREGKLLFSTPSQINMVPSGNGECFSSLVQSGALADMKRRGVTWLFYYNVDNAMIKMADPLFIGYAATCNHPIALKVIEKLNPEEKVGMICARNGRPSIMEYNEISNSLLKQRDSQDKLTLNLANISIHLFKTSFIEEVVEYEIPYHMALKKIPYVQVDGQLVNPDQPNAYKLEKFIFDFFPYAEQAGVLMVDREEEFAPIKNKEGEDSPETARRQILKLDEKGIQ